MRSEECQSAIQKKVFLHTVQSKKLKLAVDASDVGAGAVLL